MNHPSAVILATLLLTGCRKPTDGNKAAPDGGTDAGAPAAAGSVALVQTDASVPLMSITSDVKSRKDPRYPGLPLFEKLAVERSDRPAGSLHAEALYDALKGEGLSVTNRRQVLAYIVGAAYCIKADVDPDIDLTVCEFDDDATLAKGRAEILKTPYPRRELLARRTSTVGIGRLSESKATSDAAAKISAFVRKL